MLNKRGLYWLGAIAASAAVTALVSSVGRAPAASAAVSGCTDRDGDGYGLGCAAGNDCNDRDPAIHPTAAETCNFKDDNCDGVVDDRSDCAMPAVDESRVHVASGSFLMGSNTGAADEQPVHRVQGSAFAIDRNEVTNRRYQTCVQAGACARPSLPGSRTRRAYFDDPAFADYPVIFVAWAQAQAFCAFSGGRLPTEAEWERAAAGSDPRTYPWGESAPDCSKANLFGCVGDTDRVGRRLAGQSAYGVLDMAGNVWEWTTDWYDAGYYARSPSQDPTGPASGALKVMRGGCWLSDTSSLRTTCRKPELPSAWAPNVGFRCVYPEVQP